MDDDERYRYIPMPRLEDADRNPTPCRIPLPCLPPKIWQFISNRNLICLTQKELKKPLRSLTSILLPHRSLKRKMKRKEKNKEKGKKNISLCREDATFWIFPSFIFFLLIFSLFSLDFPFDFSIPSSLNWVGVLERPNREVQRMAWVLFWVFI